MPKTITIAPRTLFDPKTNEFIDCPGAEGISIEHSLYAISKWEMKYKTPFLTHLQEMTHGEFADYVRYMTITKKVNPLVYKALTNDNIADILKYMDDPMSATTIGKMPPRKGGGSHIKIVTSEVVYYWMSALHIPFECDKWHFNRLMMLIKIASIEQEPPKKMSRGEAMDQQRAIMAARRAKSAHK